MAKMTEDELKALVDSEMRNSIGYWGGKLAEQRRKAEYYYLGLPKGDLTPPEIDGRSSVVSPDVRNTIESMLPQLMLKFCGGDTVVEFEPTQPEDEQAAKQCTDYLNYLYFKKNNGHTITYTWLKDALLQKRGFLKVWWDTRKEETREEYRGLSDVELAQLMDDDEIEIIEQDAKPDEEDQEQREQALQQLGQQLQQAMQGAQMGNPQAQQAVQQLQGQVDNINQQPPKLLYDIACKRTKSGGKITVENVPPEEFLISRKAKDIATASFVGHRVLRTRSDLRSMGYKNVDEIQSDDSVSAFNQERIERLSIDDELAYANAEINNTDESQQQVWVVEAYVRCDWNGDGISELRKIVKAGNQILDNEEVDVAPFVSICPVPMPHKFFGLSVADLAIEGQKTRTSILRAQLDNMYLGVNGRYFAVNGQVNLDDLLTSRPGGVVRVDNPQAVGRLDQGMGDNNAAMGMMEYMHQFLEDSTGWSRQSQANDPNGINKTATAANIVTNKADMRVDLIARNFAEGFVDLFRMMLKLVCQHQDKESQVRLSGQWVAMDPRQWRNQFDVSINVGLGVGSKDQQVAHLMALGERQQHAFAIGIVDPHGVYELHSELAKAMGFKNADKFFKDPAKGPQQPHKPDPEQIKAQAHMQVEQAKLQANAQIEEQKRQSEAQIEQLRMQMQAQVDNNRQRAEAEQHQLKLQQEAQLEQLKAQFADQAHQRDMEFQRWKAELDASVRIQVANIGAQVKTNNAATAAAEGEISRDIQ